MDRLLAALAAAADPTRLRLIALAAGGAFCVNDFVDILGQSQPRLSRHLRLLCECGFLFRLREGANAWFSLAQGDMGALARDILRHTGEHEPQLAADRRQAARVLAERARAASETFRSKGADWDEMRALDLPALEVEARLLDLVAPRGHEHLLDIGTGTGRMLEFFAPSIGSGLGVDASRAMLALARVRLAKPEFSHCSVRLADMYALPLDGARFDIVLLQMVLHYAEDSGGVIAEARRVLAPGGRLYVVDLAPHDRDDLRAQMGHRRLGFSDHDMSRLLHGAGLLAQPPVPVAGAAKLSVRIWPASVSQSATQIVEAVL